ncbi:hypothetical protein BDN72DRAFT_383609 [Pluteus cervinus]|uniref:Uncharacterized protein n=1 Tax=Pluteus cervinus TaxID=181527 RepID=A0ACD3ACM1_9AGAR|nr:hypothetical protein BDN72DRAFT_383609 [Pluteus cervinus]
MAKKSANKIRRQKFNSDPTAAERSRLLKITRRIGPINHLPPELLVHIFFLVQSNLHNEFAANYYKWTVITQVSRSWRALARGTKQLWNVISHDTETTESAWIATSLDRSWPVHIHVVVKFDLDGEHFAFLERIVRENYRIRSLHIEVVGEGDGMRRKLKILVDLLAMEMPVLEEAILQGVNQYHWRRWVHLPTTHLFHSVAPCLKSLRVIDLKLGLHSLPFNGITSLTLYYEDGRRGDLSFRILFSFLRITHMHLQTLTLRNALPDDDTENDIDTLEPVSLTSLSSLELFALTHHCIKFLSHVIIPPSASANIRTWARSVDATTPRTFLGTVITHLSDDLLEFVDRLDLQIEDFYVSFSLRKQGDYQNGEWQHKTPVNIRCPRRYGYEWPFPSLAPFSNVSVVALTGPCIPTLGLSTILSLQPSGVVCKTDNPRHHVNRNTSFKIGRSRKGLD